VNTYKGDDFMKKKTALIAGSSGLVGGELLPLLLLSTEYEKVVSLVRTPQDIKHPKLKEIVVDFENLSEYSESFKVHDIFCCLGTTIKKAQSRDAMYKVDVEYPLSIAKLGKEMGATQFLVISSMSADPNSRIWYSKMKGILEEKLKNVDMDSLQIIRPSLLLGERKEFRFGEAAAGFLFPKISFALNGPLRKYRAIRGETVAMAMFNIAQSEKIGSTTYLSDEVARLANVGVK
jgi:uncharacterized protein YbjT (DUF2867 family)